MRFISALRNCPNHQFSRASLIQFFYEGLLDNSKDFVDACAQGSLLSLSANNAWNLLNKTISSRQQFSNRATSNVSHIQEATYPQSFDDLLRRMDKLEEQVENSKSCSFCLSNTHASSDCTLSCQEVNAMFQPRQGNYNPYSSTYNPGWRDHPNLSWRGGNTLNNPRPMLLKNNNFSHVSNEEAPRDKHYDLLMEKITSLEQVVTQLTNAFHDLKARDGSLPSSTVNNPK